MSLYCFHDIVKKPSGILPTLRLGVCLLLFYAILVSEEYWYILLPVVVQSSFPIFADKLHQSEIRWTKTLLWNFEIVCKHILRRIFMVWNPSQPSFIKFILLYISPLSDISSESNTFQSNTSWATFPKQHFHSDNSKATLAKATRPSLLSKFNIAKRQR